MKMNIIPLSDGKLEKKLSWRLFKVLYFVIGLLSGYIYSFFNSYFYTSCPYPRINESWEKEKELCLKVFDWSELFFILLFLIIILRLLFPIIEKIVLYIIYTKNK